MPGRKKKSKAAEQRKYAKKDTLTSKSIKPAKVLLCHDTNTGYNVLSGTLHQGDDRFAFPGVQCTYIFLWSLISMCLKQPHFWKPDDINSCVSIGNARFVEHCYEEKLEPKMLLVKELPQVIDVHDDVFKCQQCDHNVIVGTSTQPIDQNASDSMFESIADAIVKGLDI